MHGWQVILLAALAGALGLATQNPIAESAAAALLLVVLIAVVYRSFTGAITSARRLAAPVVPWGGTCAQSITFGNSAPLLASTVRVTDYSTLPQHPKGYVARIPARRTLTWDVVVPCHTRGRYTLGPIAVATSDPFGLFPTERLVDRGASVLVLPRWVALSRCVFSLDGPLPGEQRGAHASELPPTIAGVRAYQPGDPLAKIHWRASARERHLMTKRYDPEAQSTVWLALDLDGPLAAQTEELLVTATTSLAMYGLQRSALRVGMVVSGLHPATLLPERDRAQQRRIQETLAEAHAEAPNRPIRPASEITVSDDLAGAARRRQRPSAQPPQSAPGARPTRRRQEDDALSGLQERLAALHRVISAEQVLVLVTTHDITRWEATLTAFRQRGVAIRVIQAPQGTDPFPRQGQPERTPDPAQPATDARPAPERQWPVPFVVLSAELGDPANEAALTQALEAGGMGGYPTQGGRR